MSEQRIFPEQDCLHFSKSIDQSVRTFIARMRFHQSWYRHIVLGLGPGTNPHAGGKVYGSMLRQEDGDAGRNFLSPAIFAIARDRFPPSLGRGVTGRTYNNLLGSQPMCFNLFGPLKSDTRGLGTGLMRLLPGFPADATVTDVLFDYSPRPKEQYLNDETHFDCFVEYRRSEGTLGFVGVESKLTEPFSQTEYAFGDRYARWNDSSSCWWKPGAEARFSAMSFNQLWRNQLLVYSMLNEPEAKYKEGSCAVVYPAGDTRCSDAIRDYRSLLTAAGSEALLDWPMEAFVPQWELALTTRAEHTWIASFIERYLDFGASENAWQVFASSIQ